MAISELGVFPEKGIVLPPGYTEARIVEQPQMKDIVQSYSLINASVALDVYRALSKKYFSGDYDDNERKMYADALDRLAHNVMEKGLMGHKFFTYVSPEACEGGKENVKARESGVGPTDLPVLEGYYGNGMHVLETENLAMKEKAIPVAIDPIEGTTKTTLNQDGAFSIIAGTLGGKLFEVPSDETSARYADRIVAPARLKGKVSLLNTTEENIAAVMEAYGLSNPKDVEVVIMDRSRNSHLINASQEFGANIKRINSGDLEHALRAVTSDSPILSMGSGGKPEALIAAIAAKALDGVFEMRYVTKNGDLTGEYPGVLPLDAIVSGSASDCFVNFASITGVQSLNIPRPQQDENGFVMPVATITGKNPFLQLDYQKIA